MKRFLLIVTGTALVVAGAAGAQVVENFGSIPNGNANYGPDFWFSSMVVRDRIVQIGVSTLDEYGLTEDQQAQFVEQYNRIEADYRRKAAKRTRDLCAFEGSTEELARYFDAERELRIQQQTEAANKLKSALDAATVLALNAETATVPSQELQNDSRAPDVLSGELDLAEIKARKECSEINVKGKVGP